MTVTVKYPPALMNLGAAPATASTIHEAIAAANLRTLLAAPTGPQYPRDPAWGELDLGLALALHDATNRHRKALGLGPLVRTGALTAGAEWGAAHMAYYGYLAHDDPAPPVARSWFARLTDNGYPASGAAAAENAAYAFDNADLLLAAFLNEPVGTGHRWNIENPYWTATGVGVGIRVYEDGRRMPFWKQEFGIVTGAPLPPPPPPPIDPPPPPPPPPPPATGGPLLGQRWRNKTTKKTVTIIPNTTPTSPRVFYRADKSGLATSKPRAAFMRLFEKAS